MKLIVTGARANEYTPKNSREAVRNGTLFCVSGSPASQKDTVGCQVMELPCSFDLALEAQKSVPAVFDCDVVVEVAFGEKRTTVNQLQFLGRLGEFDFSKDGLQARQAGRGQQQQQQGPRPAAVAAAG